MKKIVYKSIFSILFVLLSLFMLPKKEVKALEYGYPRYLLKADLYQYFYEKANASTHEYLVQYVIDGIAINTINDYFFTFIHYSAINKGYDVGRNSYELEGIEIGYNPNDWTLINVRFTFTNVWLNQNYGGYDSFAVQPLFYENSAFYVAYNVYNWGYDNGFKAGRDFGRGIGYQEGYVNGHDEGYNSGYNSGYNTGLEDGYNQGYEEGEWYGYHEGYNNGYNKGLDEGIEQGYDVGYNDGYQEGYDVGINTNNDYMLGYQDGFRAGEKSKIAQNNETFYKSIEKWLVPSIITVIVLGGIVSIIAIKRREQ